MDLGQTNAAIPEVSRRFETETALAAEANEGLKQESHWTSFRPRRQPELHSDATCRGMKPEYKAHTRLNFIRDLVSRNIMHVEYCPLKDQ